MSIVTNAHRGARALAMALALVTAALACTAPLNKAAATKLIIEITPAGEEPRPAPPTDLRPTFDLFSGTDEPFDLSDFDRPAADMRKWRRVRGAIEQDRGILDRCRSAPDECPLAARQFLSITDAAQVREGRARLGEVNRAFNLAIRYRSDAVRHGKADAWSAPLAALAEGEGDCEDYAIAKYMALLEIGVRAGDLRLVLVRDTKLNQDHAVLAARLGERWLLLDNRRFSLIEDRHAVDYRPLSAFGPATGLLQVADDGEARPDTAPDL